MGAGDRRDPGTEGTGRSGASMAVAERLAPLPAPMVVQIRPLRPTAVHSPS